MPLVIAFVVLPTASRSVSTRAPFSSMSPDISAMPCALSEIGPKVSIATITPTVVSRPVPASATANSDSTIEPPPSRNAPYTPAAMTSAEYTADSYPTEMPDRMTVAGPVSEVLPMSCTGRRPGSVKYPVSAWMTAASTMPMTTATIAITRGLRVWSASGDALSWPIIIIINVWSSSSSTSESRSGSYISFTAFQFAPCILAS